MASQGAVLRVDRNRTTLSSGAEKESIRIVLMLRKPDACSRSEGRRRSNGIDSKQPDNTLFSKFPPSQISLVVVRFRQSGVKL